MCSKADGKPVGHYNLLFGRKRSNVRYIIAHPGDPICPRIHIPAKFDWKGANGLLLELYYNAHNTEALVKLPIPRHPKDEAITLDVETWPVWNKATRQWEDAKFTFREPEVKEV